MINRVIIRIKVLQIVYAFYQKDSKNLKAAEDELMRSLKHAYDLYHSLLFLIVVLTDAEQKRLDLRKYKFLPTDADLAPDERLINNRFAEQLRVNSSLEKYINSIGNIWLDDESGFLRNILNEILDSDIYQNYLTSEDSYSSDLTFWHKVFKNIILKSDRLKEIVNDNSIYVDDDLELVGSFVLKTIKKFEEGNGKEQKLLPMFKDEEDREYAVQLLHKAIAEKEENSELINKQIKNWEIERIALMDLYIMQIALSEIKNFPSIPTSVSLNEYIDLARYYSTPKSSVFINGILDAIVNEMKKEGLLFKS